MKYLTFPHKRLLQPWHYEFWCQWEALGNRIRAKNQVFQGPFTSFGGWFSYYHCNKVSMSEIQKNTNMQQYKRKKIKITSIFKSPEVISVAFWYLLFHSFCVYVCLSFFFFNRNKILISLQTAFFHLITHCIHYSIPFHWIDHLLRDYLEWREIFYGMVTS